MQRDMQGRVALVTGAAHGIGFGIASLLAARGAKVVISDVDLQAGESAAKHLEGRGDTAAFIAADVSIADQIQTLVEEVETRFAGIDILVNNAGIVSKGNIAEVGLEQWERLFAVDVTSVFLLTKAVLPHMAERQWGRIVNIASVAGQQGGGLLGNSCYAAAKGAVIAFSKGIAREVGPSNITCNSICPALTETGMTASLPMEQRDRILAAMPLGRAGRPEDIAEAVAFLASDAAAFITGVTLNVDGGFMRH
ncbi:3-oxoacyl-ACP reductase family protein [Rhizobium sp. ICMP 5592]|uniref:SDR family NAD(P)-dependent oxidoreductase n=1 Tax=Rhizobium sp. ICMP 5592 TaxID=2292445 RepID=UPI0012955128|nr:3-oxoacyl-ACP reductase family protein [Rhizobium sp. ICMP 5592]MQB46024.1 3-oxoacyl-ACP reductase FabG [Rhizobium sp. ICMP 5592]